MSANGKKSSVDENWLAAHFLTALCTILKNSWPSSADPINFIPASYILEETTSCHEAINHPIQINRNGKHPTSKRDMKRKVFRRKKQSDALGQPRTRYLGAARNQAQAKIQRNRDFSVLNRARPFGIKKKIRESAVNIFCFLMRLHT